jgi:hypothetical protein
MTQSTATQKGDEKGNESVDLVERMKGKGNGAMQSAKEAVQQNQWGIKSTNQGELNET